MMEKNRVNDFWNKYFLHVLIVLFGILFIFTRAAHLTGPIDEPHSWRQSDTAQYARAFYEDGIDLMRPSVGWMGNYKTVLLEFPFPEALMALTYNVFGYHLFLARLLTLVFFVSATIYLFFIIRELIDSRIAVIAACVYIILPLSQFYSRAVHVDFYAVFFAHAMTYHLIRALRQPKIWEVGLAIVMGIFSFLIKAPYAFYFFLLLAFVVAEKRTIKSFFLLGGCILAIVTPFLLWRLYVSSINAAAPDWYFIPGYGKFINMNGWYFGSLSMRMDINVWKQLLGRFRYDIVADFGVSIFLIGVIVSITSAVKGSLRKMVLIWSWFIGTVIYVVIFLNLNYIHDYYQIPLLGASAVIIAIGIDIPRKILGRQSPIASSVLSLLLLVFLSINCIWYSQNHYFTHDHLREMAGDIIAQNTPENALVIISPDIPGTDPRDPRLLFRAERYGWSIYLPDLSKELINLLKEEGASHLAIIAAEPNYTKESFGYVVKEYPIGEGDWKVFISNLDEKK